MKRILILDHPQFTSATYYLWHGLKEIEELYPRELEVDIYPYTPAHYFQDNYDLNECAWFSSLNGHVEYWKMNPGELPQGIPPFQKDETLTANNVTMIERGIKHRNFRYTKKLEHQLQVVDLINQGYYHLVVLGNSNRVPTIALALLKAQVREKMPPIVYLDAGERDELNEHWIHVFRPELVFKQILTPEVKAKGLTVQIPGYNLKMFPLPLSSPVVDHQGEINHVPIQWLRNFSKIEVSKAIDVFYALGITWPERQKIIDRMDNWTMKESFRRSAIFGAPGGTWWISLAISRMGVSMRGSGRDTNRYWDIPTFCTALVCDGTMGCIHPYPFEDGKTAFFYKDPEHLVEIINRNLKDWPSTMIVAKAGMEHLARYHSTAARAIFFLDILHKELGWMDPHLIQDVANWKSLKNYDGRPWEGAVV